MAESWDLAVRKDDLRKSTLLDGPPADGSTLQEGQILVAVDHVALTANNVTYAVLGDELRYWQFFPAPDPWGKIPVWGYAEVTHSRSSAIAPGTRIFGYLPLATHSVLQPGAPNHAGFTDRAPHRRELPAVYNEYQVVTRTPGREHEERFAVFMPLYGTSWLLADWLADSSFLGASQVVASAASSKTALGLGHAIQRDHHGRVATVGLTAPAHREFTESTGHWDRVVTYDELEELDPDIPTVYADVAGNAGVRLRVHTHFRALSGSVAVGLADWEATRADPAAPSLPRPKPQLFFAPEWIERRNQDWGAAELGRRLSASRARFIERSHDWMKVRTGSGADAIRSELTQLMNGEVPPDIGVSVSPSS